MIKCFVTTPGVGEHPTEPGQYAADTVNGWRVLEWSDGAWWFPGKPARWMAAEPKQWVGPLPPLQRAETPPPVFDL